MMSTMGMSIMELVVDGGQLLACSSARSGEQAVLGWPTFREGLLVPCESLDPGPRLWRLEEELAGLSQDLEGD